ncbi:MAG: hypothetical protein EBQ56_09305 [Proteobacteria bacterium]|nr:hypothetical protein [Pseudomonadota bacterium]NBX48143.1 hypothetical protein [Chloroflexota bacterium]NBT02194.1 hypothetical protein [Pseudomonadota bacterium]NBT18651.1 hypothetical protein [Pseudomonadota bacterium]NBY47953.1 hypothetical protein [Pseudomonadota bacterium]
MVSGAGLPGPSKVESDGASSPASQSTGDKWAPRVEGEEGDPTWFDFVFGGAVVAVVGVGILWAMGYVSF